MLLLKLSYCHDFRRKHFSMAGSPNFPKTGTQHWGKAIPGEGSVQHVRMSLSKKGRETNPMVEKALLKPTHLEQMLPERGRRMKNEGHVKTSQPGIQGGKPGWPQRKPFQLIRANLQQRGKFSEMILVVKRRDIDRTRKMGCLVVCFESFFFFN